MIFSVFSRHELNGNKWYQKKYVARHHIATSTYELGQYVTWGNFSMRYGPF